MTPVIPFNQRSREGQQDYVTRAIRVWSKRLKIQHVKVVLNFDEAPEDEDAIASVNPSSMYDYAMIRLSEDFWEEEELFEVNRVLVHELMHVMFRDTDTIFELALRQQSYDARGILQNQWTHATEAIVDRLAHRLVEGFGVVK